MDETQHAVLIDTDIGDDVDDAFGLALAAAHPALRVCGVTTVCGPTDKRAQLAAIILAAAGQSHVPVIPGNSTISDGRPGSPRFSHQPLLGTQQDSYARDTGQHAVDLILDRSRHEPALTLVALGPLTNIAAALKQDPILAQRVRLVAMAGGLGIPYPDWNLRCDPNAARVVLASGMPIMLVGMNLTMRCKMRPAQVRRLFANPHPLAALLTRCVLAWRTWKRRMPILHDALTVAAVADPQLVTFVPRHVQIFRLGFSTEGQHDLPNAQMGSSLDLERFHAMIDQHLLNASVPLQRPHGLIERIVQLVA